MTVAARWGHQAAYVPSQQALYVVGGQVSTTNTKITNDVLVLQLNETNPSFSLGTNAGLPPHAFASMTMSENDDSLVVVGGMTSSCANDGTAHTLNFGNGRWQSSSPTGFTRRRNGGIASFSTNGPEGAVIVVGGISDSYSCAATTTSVASADVLSLPMNTTSVISTRAMPASLTGSRLAVSDFAMTIGPDGTVYLAGGQNADGNFVGLTTIGVWSKAKGWSSQATTGDVPAGRTGATLVAHPTLDMLVLHGGDASASDSNPTPLVAFLNTTTWSWTMPTNLQPPASSSVAYHTSVMTPSGVMISAFGMGTNGPRSDMYFLDLRDPTGSAWTWKSYWKPEMLEAYNAGDSGSSTTTPIAKDPKKLTSIVVPVVVGLLILIPLAIWFIRRKLRIARKRREARHFSFEEQEDSGAFTKPFKISSRKTNTKYSFGNDANEKEGTWMTDLKAGITGLASRFRKGDPVLDMHRRSAKENRRGMNWEEIDFGLDGGEKHQLIESRNSSFSATGSPKGQEMEALGVASTNPFGDQHAAPLIVTIHEDSPRLGTPTNDGQHTLFPTVSVIPPTPAPVPSASAMVDPATGLDWNLLAQELEQKPAFRSISPTSTLRSHAHGPVAPQPRRGSSPNPQVRKPIPPIAPIRVPSPTGTFGGATPVVQGPASPVSPIRPVGPAPVIPSFEFQRNSTSSAGSITLVDPRTGRRTSTESFPQPNPRVASPNTHASNVARQLTGRRGSAPALVVTPTDFAAPAAEYNPGSLQGRRGSALRIANNVDDGGSPRAL